MNVLIAEDDKHIREGLAEVFEREGYTVATADDGTAALALYKNNRPDVVCLDIMMPGMNGYDVCREIRKADTEIPVIFISAKSEEVDRVLGLELGADDFIMKPFGVREVVARIRAVTRRALRGNAEQPRESFRMGDLEVFPSELRARRDGQTIDLSLREIRLLESFHAHPGEVLDRDTLMDQCWGQDYFPNSRTLDQHISQLRKKIESDPKHPEIIQTVHGAGYRFEGWG